MKLIRLKETGSTNSDAFQYLQQGFDPVAVIADRQTGGRGRGSNRWVSPKGNLYLSVGSTCPVSSLRHLSVRAGVQLALALNHLVGKQIVQVKWPNDLMIGDTKTGGILVESRTRNDRCQVVIGLGLNVLQAPIDGATCLTAHLSTPVEELAPTAIPALLTAIRDADPSRLHPALKQVSWLQPGDLIRFRDGATSRSAAVVGYDDTLALQVRMNGDIVSLQVSAVSRVRRTTEKDAP